MRTDELLELSDLNYAEASREMARQLALVNPHATLFELSGTGHLAPLTHAAKLHEAMRAHTRAP